jgi:hypothetical protein
MRSQPASNFALATVFTLVFWLSATGIGYAQHGGPFARMAGAWNGAGMLELSDGKKDKIRCHATYDVASPQSLQLSIRCASESYNFEIRSTVTHAAGAVTGTWSESATGAIGDISGRVSGGHISATARAASFSASLNLVTNGNQQSVTIRSKDPQSSIKGVSIAMRR